MNRPTKRNRIVWTAFLGIVAAFMAVFELPAVFDSADGNTLSEYVWFFTGQTWLKIFAAPLFVFLCWLAVHFWPQTWRRK